MFNLLTAVLLKSSLAFGEFDETLIQPPLKESNQVALFGRGCRNKKDQIWNSCYTIDKNENQTPASFSFMNRGPNKIVQNEGFMVGRDFEFMYEDTARSDMGILIWDFPNDTTSMSHLKMMFFFPREILPSIRHEMDSTKDTLIVTLPNYEEVIFDGKTFEVLSGVLKEGPIRVNANEYAFAPDLTYTGDGVVIEASAQADWPVGLMDKRQLIQKVKYATIKKRGHKDCKIKASELWYTDKNLNNNVLFRKNLYSNEAFNQFSIKKCGFSIY